MAKDKIIDRRDCETLLGFLKMEKVSVQKIHTRRGPVYAAVSASGRVLGKIGRKYRYMFENAIIELGNNDGLFDGFSQTAGRGRGRGN